MQQSLAQSTAVVSPGSPEYHRDLNSGEPGQSTRGNVQHPGMTNAGIIAATIVVVLSFLNF